MQRSCCQAGHAVARCFFEAQGRADAAWLLTDHLGSVVSVTDNSGVLQDTIRYDGYGNITSESASSWGGRYKWTGREQDTETGFQYNRARYYEAGTGRWTSQDPMAFEAGDSNLYRYTNNSFTNATDPSGKDIFVLVRQSKFIGDHNTRFLRPFINTIAGLDYGHLAIIIGPLEKRRYFIYMSFSPHPFGGANNLYDREFTTFDEALRTVPPVENFTYITRWHADQDADAAAIHAVTVGFSDTNYNLFGHNCCSVAYAALSAALFKVTNIEVFRFHVGQRLIEFPEEYLRRLVSLNSGNSPVIGANGTYIYNLSDVLSPTKLFAGSYLDLNPIYPYRPSSSIGIN
jgi:RHS repeat-associated protein